MTANECGTEKANTISAIFYNFRIVISTPLRRIKCFLLLLLILLRSLDNVGDRTTIWWETYSANKLFRRKFFSCSFFSFRFLGCDACCLFSIFSCSLFSRFAWISFVFIYCFSSLWTYDAPDAHREFIGRDNDVIRRWWCWCCCGCIEDGKDCALRMHVYKAIALSQWIDETPRETQNKLNKTCKFSVRLVMPTG